MFSTFNLKFCWRWCSHMLNWQHASTNATGGHGILWQLVVTLCWGNGEKQKICNKLILWYFKWISSFYFSCNVELHDLNSFTKANSFSHDIWNLAIIWTLLLEWNHKKYMDIGLLIISSELMLHKKMKVCYRLISVLFLNCNFDIYITRGESKSNHNFTLKILKSNDNHL